MKKNTIHLLFFLLLFFAAVYPTSIRANARPEKIAFYFRVGSSVFDRSYAGNRRSLAQLHQVLVTDTNLDLKRLVVVGGASPEGGYIDNIELSRSRTETILHLLKDRYSWLFADERLPITVQAVVSEPLDQSAEANKIEKMRYAALHLFYDDQPMEEPAVQPEVDQMIPLPAMVLPSKDLAQLAPSPDSATSPTVFETLFVQKPLFALKTNLLFDLASALNLEIEIPIGRQWSIAVEGVFPWWLWDSKQLCLQMISGHIEGRYWFDQRIDRPLFTGWFVGIYGGYGYYDFEFGGHRGIQGEFRNVGVSGGYGHRIGKNLSLEYSLGLGYAQSNYRNYEARQDEAYDWYLYRQETKKADWFGPTRLKVSLVWMLNYNKTKRKN